MSTTLAARTTPRLRGRTIATLSLAAAAGIHLAVAIGSGGRIEITFFAATALLQTATALSLAGRGARGTIAVAVASSLALVFLWAASRTIGVPFGPHPWTPEPAGAADLAASGLEVLAIWALAPSFAPGTTTRDAGVGRAVVLTVVLAAAVFAPGHRHVEGHGAPGASTHAAQGGHR